MNNENTCCNHEPNCNLEMGVPCSGVTMHGCGNPAYNVYCWDHAHHHCHKPQPVAVSQLSQYVSRHEGDERYASSLDLFNLSNYTAQTYQTKEDALLADERLNQEIIDRQNADTVIEGELRGQGVMLEGIISAEVNRAKAAEQTLQDNITAEANRARSAETNLDTRLNIESDRARTKENQLEQALNSEINRATIKETELGNAINDESHRAQQAEWLLDTAVRANTAAIANEEDRAEAAEGGLTQAIYRIDRDLQDSVIRSADYDPTTRMIQFKNWFGTVMDTIDATAFVKDGMISDVQIVNDTLKITFNTDAGKNDIDVPIASIFNADNYYTKALTNALFVSVEGAIDSGNSDPITIDPATEEEILAYVNQTAATAVNNAMANYSTTAQMNNALAGKADGISISNRTISLKSGSTILGNVTVPSDGTTITTDAVLNSTSTNPIQNAAVATAISNLESSVNGSNGISARLTDIENAINGTGSGNEHQPGLSEKILNIITTGGEPNTIEGIKVNNVTVAPDENKIVNISVPSSANFVTLTQFNDAFGINASNVAALKALMEDESDTTGVLLELSKKADSSDIPTKLSDLTTDDNFKSKFKTINSLSIFGTGNIAISSGVSQLQSNWTLTNTSAVDYIQNKPTLASVATSGSYSDLTNKPTIPAITLNGNTVSTLKLWTGSQSAYDAIENKDANTFYFINE